MKIKAAVLNELNTPLSLEDVELDSPKAGEVRIKLVATGLCATDVNQIHRGGPLVPIVLGHEGAGIIQEVGEGVAEFKVGDKVALSYTTCGQCEYCRRGQTSQCRMLAPLNFMGGIRTGTTRLSRRERPIMNFFGQSSFASQCVVNAGNCVKIPDEMDINIAGPFGCGFITGAGTVFEFCGEAEGKTAVFYGPGAVCFAGIMAAKICGFKNIIAVGRTQSKLELALKMGATHIINSKEAPDVVAEIKKINKAGADFQMDTTGVNAIVQQMCLAAAKLGRIAIAGVMKEDTCPIPMTLLMSKNVTLGMFLEGNCNNRETMKKLFNYYLEGRFPVDKLISFYDFEDINKAIDDLEHQRVIKAVMKFKD